MNTETLFSTLLDQLHQWDKRRRLRDGLLLVPRGLLVGLLIAVLVATVARLRPLLTHSEMALTALGLAVAGTLAITIWIYSQKRDSLAQAHFADNQFRLQERASTAVEIKMGKLEVPATLAHQQLNNTLQAITHIDTPTLLPLNFHRQDWLIILIATVLLTAAYFLPNPQETILQSQRAIQTAIEEQAEQIQALITEIQQNPQLTPEEKAQLLEPLEGVLETLQQSELSQEEAVAALSEAEADLRSLESASDTSNLRQTLQQSAQALLENSASEAIGQALQNGDLATASQATNDLADQLPQLTPEELAELAANLAEAAQALQEADSELAAQLAEAAQALQNGDVAAAQQALRQVAGTLQERAQSQNVAETAAETADQLGQGQNEVAQAGGQGQQPTQAEGQGQGQSNGQGEGNGEGQGEGNGNNSVQSLESGSGQQTEQGEGTGGPGPGGGHTENVYVPPAVDLSGEEGIDVELPAECVANPENCGSLLNQNPTELGDESSTVSYDQVFGDYRDAAYEALDVDYIPLGMKDLVRDYFSSLEP